MIISYVSSKLYVFINSFTHPIECESITNFLYHIGKYSVRVFSFGILIKIVSGWQQAKFNFPIEFIDVFRKQERNKIISFDNEISKVKYALKIDAVITFMCTICWCKLKRDGKLNKKDKCIRHVLLSKFNLIDVSYNEHIYKTIIRLVTCSLVKATAIKNVNEQRYKKKITRKTKCIPFKLISK